MRLTENLLRATLQYLQRDDTGRERTSRKRFVGIHAEGWLGPSELQVGAESYCVKECRSPLAVRAAMDSFKNEGSRLVIVTPCEPQDLGCDVEARVIRNRFQRADPWQALLARFDAERIAPSVPREDWVRDLLLALPDRDLPRLQTSIVLDVETVWAAIFRALNIPQEANVQALLRWAESDRVSLLAGRPQRLLDGIRERLTAMTGPIGGILFDGALSGHGDKLTALGLVIRALIAAANRPGANEVLISGAIARIERFVAETRLEIDRLAPWANGAESLVGAMLTVDPSHAKSTINRAEELLDRVGVRELAKDSNYLRAGLLQREQALADALTAALQDPQRDVGAVEKAASQLKEHALLPIERKGRELAITMSVRLLRWLRLPESAVTEFRALATEYATSTSYVDYAREALSYGGPLQEALRCLWNAVLQRREAFNKRFAKALAKEVATPSEHQKFIPLEDILHRVVAPLAEQSKLLLVVLDGASLAVFHEIISGLTGWEEVGPDPDGHGAGQRLHGIAVMPTITSISRASLFGGKITQGNQQTEKAAFAGHEFLRTRRKPVLFHKDDLSGDRLGLAAQVASAISGDTGPKVVGVVVNAIDDWLSKGDQDAAVWSVERIKPLAELLQCAAASDRTLVITSDHGHVREHSTSFTIESQASRHRMGTNAHEGEIRLEGQRVHPEMAPLITPWSECIRYTRNKQHGYHGGATPQEVLVPLSIFVPAGTELEGYEPLAAQQPVWWESVVPEPATPVTEQPKAKKKRKELPMPTTLLPFRSAQQDLVADLLQSELYRAQAEAAGKMRVPDERVSDILGSLAEAGGSMTLRALSAKLGLPIVRVNGHLMGLRRILNLDGVEVLEFDTASSTVRVHWSLLRTQFELGGS